MLININKIVLLNKLPINLALIKRVPRRNKVK